MARRLLAVLLLHANRVVPTTAIATELWGWPLPPRARKTVQTHVYHLRRTLSDESATLIKTKHNGYVIQVRPEQLDLSRFDALEREGRCALAAKEYSRAAAVFGKALELWRGPALGDCAVDGALGGQVAHLEDRKLAVLESRIDAELALGLHRKLLAELSALVKAHPLNENLTAMFMVAARRSGRRAEALEMYRRLRTRMTEELGLEPSERLRELQAEVLSGSGMDHSAEVATAVVPAQLPLDIPHFVGRREELALITRELPGDPGRKFVPIVSVLGGPGAGKTALAVRAAHRLRSQFSGGSLFAELHDENGDPVKPSDVLHGFLTALGMAASEVPAGLVDRARMFRSLAAERRLLVVLDDAASTTQVQPLLPGSGECAVLVTAQCRLAGLPALSTVELNSLSVTEGAALISSVLDVENFDGELEYAKQVSEFCEGLPLALRGAAERLASRRAWTVRKLQRRLENRATRIGELCVGNVDLRRRFDAAIGRLSPRARQALAALCDLPCDRFDLNAVARALEVDELSAEEPIGELVGGYLLHVVGTKSDGMAWFRFPELLRLHVQATHTAGHAEARARRPGRRASISCLQPV